MLTLTLTHLTQIANKLFCWGMGSRGSFIGWVFTFDLSVSNIR